MSRLRAAPGVRAAGVVSFLPLCGWSSDTNFVDPARSNDVRDAGVLVAEPGYFSTLHIPIVQGRNFLESDDAKAQKAILVDMRFVQKHLLGREPLGIRLNLGSATEPDWREIVGVVGNVQNDPPPSPQRAMIYLPFSQEDFPAYGLVARGDGDPNQLAATLRDVVASIDRDQPVSYAVSMEALVGDALAVDRTSTFILSFFAFIAIALAAMGVYGVLAHHVLERQHEIGIRLALGAQSRHVLGFMLRRLFVMAGAGIVLGVGGTLVGARVLQAMLYGISSRDPVLLGVVVGLLAVTTLLAAYLPLRRALHTDPMVALRVQ
jgi:putative ABC transport system permease protein